MATRKLTLTIPDSLAARLDAYPGNLKLSAFLQEKLTEFLDAEDAKTMELMREQQALDNKALDMVMAGQHVRALEEGRKAGESWAESLKTDQLMAAHSRAVLVPYPLELGRADLLPKSLLKDDRRLKSYVETMLGAEVMNAFISSPEPVFMLPSGKRDEALVWVYGWNTGLDDARRERRELEMMTEGPSVTASPTKQSRRKRPTK